MKMPEYTYVAPIVADGYVVAGKYTYVALIDASGYVVGTGKSDLGFEYAKRVAQHDNLLWWNSAPWKRCVEVPEEFYVTEMNSTTYRHRPVHTSKLPPLEEP